MTFIPPVLKPGDVHFDISHGWRSMKVFRKTEAGADLLHKTDALTSGVGGSDQSVTNSDTPFGWWEHTGDVVPTASDDHENMAIYGPFFLYILGISGQPRSDVGIGMHGGRQGEYAYGPGLEHTLEPTHGCIRVYNEDLNNWIVKLVRDTIHAGHKSYITVGP